MNGVPRLHVLVSERELERPEGAALVERILERAAPSAVHLRARLDAGRLFEVAERLVAVADRCGGWLVVNGRPDIALAAGARAVQLGRTALGVGETRKLVETCRGSLVIGASVHAAEAALAAVRAGADYLVLGTIYPTPSHPGATGEGVGAIRAVRAHLSAERDTPILAIGGLDATRIGEVLGAGAHGIVVGRAVWAAPDAVRAALELKRGLAAAHQEAEPHVG